MKQTAKKILKKWQLWYWIMAFTFLSQYVIGPGDLSDLAGVFYLIYFICPAFLIINIVIIVIKNRSAVIRNWRFWICIILLFVNLFVNFLMIVRPVRHATPTPIDKQFLSE